jgi:hypothetical protein
MNPVIVRNGMLTRSEIPRLFYIWAAVFLYALLAMFFYRQVLLPLVEPKLWNGLIPGDPQYYHHLAAGMAERIVKEGWSSWIFRPQGNGNVGILAAVYAVFGSNPSLIIPINALLHSVAFLALFGIAREHLPLRLAAVVCMPFVLSPYMISWYSQPNKDSFVAAGVFLFLYGCIQVTKNVAHIEGKKKFWYGLISFGFGAILISIARPYLIGILQVINWILFPISVVFLWRVVAIKKFLSPTIAIIRVLAIAVLLIAIMPLTKSWYGNAVTWDAEYATSHPDAVSWDRTKWLPEELDYKLYGIAVTQRHTYNYLINDTNVTTREMLIDLDHKFSNATDVLEYLPRSIQIGIFAPFPNKWSFMGIPSKSVFRNFVTFEMVLIYASLVFFAIGVVKFTRDVSSYLVMLYCVPIISLYALATPHIGALYRYRFPFILILVTLGLVVALRLWHEKDKLSDAAT